MTTLLPGDGFVGLEENGTVPAGVSTYGDGVDASPVGTEANYQVVSTAGSSNTDGATKSVECAS